MNLIYLFIVVCGDFDMSLWEFACILLREGNGLINSDYKYVYDIEALFWLLRVGDGDFCFLFGIHETY